MTGAHMMAALPPMWQNLDEFSQLYRTAAEYITHAEKKICQHDRNLYPASDGMDTDGIDRWIQALKLNAGGMTPDEKQYRIRSLLLERRPYTLGRLNMMLDELYGKEQYVLLVNVQESTVNLSLAESQTQNIGSITALLDRILPASMVISVSQFNRYSDISASQKTHDDLSVFTHEQIRSDISWRI